MQEDSASTTNDLAWKPLCPCGPDTPLPRLHSLGQLGGTSKGDSTTNKQTEINSKNSEN